jgi:hypothetical protein
VYKLDRYARVSTELILETKELTDKGVGFISLSDNLDFTTAAGKLKLIKSGKTRKSSLSTLVKISKTYETIAIIEFRE